MATHIIHKQRVILNVSKREEAQAFQDRVSTLLQQELANTMEAVFDELFPSDEIIRIDSLQLDLGNINSQHFEQEFKDQLIKELRKNLSSKKEVLNKEDNGEILSSAQSLFKAFIYFLENGYLPWYSTVKEIQDWEDDIIKSLSEGKNRQFITWLHENYKNNPVVLKRLIFQFTDSFLEKLLLTISPETDESWSLIYGDIAVIISNSIKKSPDLRNELWRCVFNSLLDDPALWNNATLTSASDSELVLQILVLLSDCFNIAGADITMAIEISIGKQLKTNIAKKAFGELKLFLAAKEGFRNDADKHPSSKADYSKDGDEFLKRRSKQPENTQADNLKRNNKEDARLSPYSKKNTGITEQESLYVKNGGVVIIHYFLKAFFTGLDLMTDGKFTDDDTRQRAVLLLHYLATGNLKVAEFNLIIEKILCGYPLEETLPATIILSRKEKTESKKLLEAIIGHWPPLKNSSVEGLRNTFFERDGKLSQKESGWLLTVEQKTVDILLGKLPWGFSTIRLPWMQELLNVDWY